MRKSAPPGTMRHGRRWSYGESGEAPPTEGRASERMTPVNANGEGLLGIVLQDSFRLTRMIGQGGMGTVYEGTQLRLNKRVAVKVLARQLASNEEALARF